MDMIRFFAIVFGLIFLGIGIAGFVPSMVPDGLLFGYFQVDVMHNLVHIFSGVFALLASVTTRYARLYFLLFGLLYGAVAILGFVYGDSMMMRMNMADNILHVGISIVALYLGIFFRRRV